MPTAWRLVKAVYAKTAFSGEWAARFGRRWNPRGVPMIYTAGTASLAILDVLVHTAESALPAPYTLFRVELPESRVHILAPGDLPPDWDTNPPPPSTQAIGKRWIESRTSVALEVPSTVTRQETNFLLNPEHPAFQSILPAQEIPYLFPDRLIDPHVRS